MLAELMGDLPTGHPGCLIAAYCYQDQLFDQQVRDLNTSAVLAWRKRFRQRLDEIAALYPPKIAVDLDDLADMLSVIADGGIILESSEGPRRASSPSDALSRVRTERLSARLE